MTANTIPVDYWHHVVNERRTTLRKALGPDLLDRVLVEIPADATAEMQARILRAALGFWATHGDCDQHVDELVAACKKAMEG
jgi:hypothetical protein